MLSPATVFVRRVFIVVALMITLAVLARAQTRERESAPPASPPATAAASAAAEPPPPATNDEAVLDQVLDGRLPGDQASKSLHKALSVPTAESRWRGLPLFGRELFRPGAESSFAPIENAPVGPDYVLGPGDNLIAFVSSLRDTAIQLTLDREGKVFLPQVGSTFLWGLSFADAEALIRARLATVLRGARVHVSMGRVRALDVFVAGAVRAPGKYTVTGMATALNAVSATGGPTGLGSLRDIRVLRGNKKAARLDLYHFLLAGNRSNNTRLKSGDVVYVGLIQSQVGIQGAVLRPGVFETAGPVSLRELMTMAGGASPFADLERIRIERVDANGGFRLQDLPLDHGHGIDPDSLTLSNYDLVTVLPLNERVRNLVTLDGFVRHPGEYELTPGMKLSGLVSRDRVLPEAALDQAELRRVDPTTFVVQVKPFSIRTLWQGTGDLELQALDAVTVFSQARFPHTATLDGEVVRPGSYSVTPGERLSDVLKRAGGVTATGWLPASVFLRRSAAEQSRERRNDFLQRQRLALAQQQTQLIQSGDSLSAAALTRAQSALTQALADQADPGRVVLRLDPAGKWIGTSDDPVIEDGDHLSVPMRPATVLVLGSVMNPGTLVARKHGSFSDYVDLAGGTAHDADLSRSYVLRANGEALPRGRAHAIEPGDAIVVPPREVSTGGIGRSLGVGTRFLIEISTAAALIVAATRR